MSHFSVYVITDFEPTSEDIENALAPYHEFESTGIVDEYVVSIDETDYVKERFESRSDHCKNMSLLEFAEDYYDYPIITKNREPDIEGLHKYGWIRVLDEGLVEVVNRTNPNSKWDWWSVGGRWSNKLKTLDGEEGDFAKISNIDFQEMRRARRLKAGKGWLLAWSAAGGRKGYQTFEQIAASYEDLGREAVVNKYWTQPQLVKYLKAEERGRSIPYDLSEVEIPFEEYVRQEELYAVTPFALIHNGKWIERGKMGWFGNASGVKEQEDWYKIVFDIIKQSAVTGWITVVDCHI